MPLSSSRYLTNDTQNRSCGGEIPGRASCMGASDQFLFSCGVAMALQWMLCSMCAPSDGKPAKPNGHTQVTAYALAGDTAAAVTSVDPLATDQSSSGVQSVRAKVRCLQQTVASVESCEFCTRADITLTRLRV